MTHFSDEMCSYLKELYLKQQWPLDKLPHTKEEKELLREFDIVFQTDIGLRALWRQLIWMRKLRKGHRNRLPRHRGAGVEKSKHSGGFGL